MKYILVFCIIAVYSFSWEVKFPLNQGESEKRITIKSNSNEKWVVCKASISGGTQHQKPYVKLIGRKNTTTKYKFYHNQLIDVLIGDYKLIAGGTVCCNKKIIANVLCY